MRIAAVAHFSELLFGPADDDEHQLGHGEVGRVEALVDLGAKAAKRAAVLGHDLALAAELAHECLEPCLG